MTHIKTIFSIFLLLCIAKPADAVSDDLKQWLNKLDESLEKAPMYEAEHEQHINAMKKLLTRHESLNKRFETLHSIYLAYQSYKADSAIVYAYKSLTVAKQMRRKDYEIVAMCNIGSVGKSGNLSSKLSSLQAPNNKTHISDIINSCFII
ncbi:MAG: hypothetical protein UHO69_09875 [Prevotella sp.]|nr:hypothetical protein [Prevotella sp.]